MKFLRSTTMLKIFGCVYGPIRREVGGGAPMTAREWKIARAMMAFTTITLCVCYTQIVAQVLH